MPNINAATISSIRFDEQASTPSTPAAGFSSIYMKTDGLYHVDDAAAATKLVVNTPTTAAQNTILPSANVAALTLKAFSDATTILFDIQRSTGNGVFQVEDEGQINFGNATDVEPVLILRTPSGNNHYIFWERGGNTRWELETEGTESGSNTGTDLALNSSTDAGNALASNVLFIKRQTGRIGIGTGAPAGRLHVDGSADEIQFQVDANGTQTNDLARFGDATNYLAIEADGSWELNGTATAWEDLRVPGTTVKLGATAPDFAAFLGSGNLLTYLFDGAATAEQVYFTIQMPHGWKAGSDIYPHIHWTPTDANAGNVKWQLEYSWANIDATFAAPTTISIVDAADGTAWKHQKAQFAAIVGSGKTLSSMLVCRLFRDPADAADTYAHDAAFLQFDVHYEIDTLGSRQETVK